MATAARGFAYQRDLREQICIDRNARGPQQTHHAQQHERDSKAERTRVAARGAELAPQNKR